MKLSPITLFISLVFFPLTVSAAVTEISLHAYPKITSSTQVRDVKNIGDINGDGRDDSIAVYYTTANKLYTASILYGKATGVDFTQPDITLQVNSSFTPYWLGNFDGASDINGDGYDDFVWNSNIYYGGPNLPASLTSTDADVVVTYNNTLSDELQLAGDINGDGLGDIVLGRTSAYIVFGSATLSPKINLPAEADVSLTTAVNKDFSPVISVDGDLNHDGNADIVVNSYEKSDSVLYMFYGSTDFVGAKTIEISYDVRMTGFSSEPKFLTTADITGDEADDLIAQDNDGSYIFYGGQNFSHTLDRSAANVTITQAGRGIAASDFNQDGQDDFIIQDPHASSKDRQENGKLYVVYGSKTLPAAIDAADIPLAFIGTFDFSRIELADLVDVTGDQLDDVIVYVSGQSVRLVTSADSDGDTFSGTAGDCIDINGTVWPGAADSMLDNLDNDCDGAIDENYDFFPENGDGVEEIILATRYKYRFMISLFEWTDSTLTLKNTLNWWLDYNQTSSFSLAMTDNTIRIIQKNQTILTYIITDGMLVATPS